MKRIALRHTNQQRIGVSQQQQSIGFGFRPTLVIGGGAYTLATWEEYMQFKMHMNIKIGGLLLDKPSFDEIEKEQQIL